MDETLSHSQKMANKVILQLISWSPLCHFTLGTITHHFLFYIFTAGRVASDGAKDAVI